MMLWLSCVTLNHLHYPLRFSMEDWQVVPWETLARQMRVSRAFLRLCACLGGPASAAGASAAGLLLWLFDHYEAVRTAAGLEPLAPVDGMMPPALTRLRMANAVITLLDFARSRATDWRQKRLLRRAAEQVQWLVDRFP